MMLGVDRYGFSPTSGDLVAVLQPCLSAPSGTALPSNDPTLEERKREDRQMPKWGRVLAPRRPGDDTSNWVVKAQVCEQRINGLPDRWRNAEWWIIIECFGQM